jgi:hypothetical protein
MTRYRGCGRTGGGLLQADDVQTTSTWLPGPLLYPPDVDAGPPDRPNGDPWSDLIAGITDVRADEATRRFDAELETALADGEVTHQAAQRLRAWQRASVRGVVEHVRTVLPAILRALDTAGRDALAYAENAADHLVSLERTDAEPGYPFPDASAVATAKTETGATEPAGVRSPESGRPAQARGHGRRASPAPSGQPRTLDERRPRLLIADLRDTRKDRTN